MLLLEERKERLMQGQYKVYKTGEEYEIFYCPYAPLHYNDRVPYDGKLYSKRQAAYRRCKQLNQQAANVHGQPVQSDKTELHSSVPDSSAQTEVFSPLK
jgi:hypothetical protein